MNHLDLHKLSSLSLSVAITIGLTACGGGSESVTSDNGDSRTSIVNSTSSGSHPSFLRAKVAVSKYYEPSGNILNAMPTFKWKAVPNATRYNFGHEDTDSETRWHEYDISAEEANCASSSDCSYTPNDVEFADGDEKVWWIRAEVSGDWQDWSSSHVFKYTASTRPTINNAEAISPSGNISTLYPTFKWKKAHGATKYQIGYEGDSESDWTSYKISADNANCQATECSFTPPKGLKNGKKKNWWVRNEVNNTWGNWSKGLKFTVNANSKPFANMPNVTSILKVNNSWFGIDAARKSILEDNGSSVSAVFTSPYPITSPLYVMAGKIYYVIETRKASTTHDASFGYEAKRDLTTYNPVTHQVVDSIVAGTSVGVISMDDFMLVNVYHRYQRRADVRNYYKIDKIGSLIYLGNTFHNSYFSVKSVDRSMNVIHLVTGYISDKKETKLTDEERTGLEDE